MPRRLFIIWSSIFIASSILSISCSLKWIGRDVWLPPNLVEIKGTELCVVSQLHLLHPHTHFEPVQEGQPIYLPLRDGDLVNALENFFLYRDSDGLSLSIMNDEIRTTLNGKTVTLNLYIDEAWQWLEKATPDDLDALRLLVFDDDVEMNENQLSLLKRLSELHPNLDLFSLENSNPNWRKVISMFDPEWLLIGVDDTLEAEDYAMLSTKKQLRQLWIGGDFDISFLSQMQTFETLWLNDWDPEETGPLPKHLKNLKRLYLLELKVKNLNSLNEQPNLEVLSLELSTVDDISQLVNFPHLRELNLTGCENLENLAPLKHLKRLEWLCLPPTTTQQQLVKIVHNHPDLVGLELFETEEITDLTPLKNLHHLEYLSVIAPNADPGPLFEMNQLKWLASTGKSDEDDAKTEPKGKDLVVRLQKALPETAIVRINPLCLGSGWILLLVPAVGLAWLVGKWRNRNELASDTKDARV